jgi:hypothetical protein
MDAANDMSRKSRMTWLLRTQLHQSCAKKDRTKLPGPNRVEANADPPRNK